MSDGGFGQGSQGADAAAGDVSPSSQDTGFGQGSQGADISQGISVNDISSASYTAGDVNVYNGPSASSSGAPQTESGYGQGSYGADVSANNLTGNPNYWGGGKSNTPNVTEKTITATPNEIDLAARVILAEDRSGPLGEQGVAEVIRNRVLSGKFGNGVNGVINQNKYAFASPLTSGYTTKQYNEAYAIADAVFNGKTLDVTNGALYFANPGDSTAAGLRGITNAATPVAQIGQHVFYKPGGLGPGQTVALFSSNQPASYVGGYKPTSVPVSVASASGASKVAPVTGKVVLGVPGILKVLGAPATIVKQAQTAASFLFSPPAATQNPSEQAGSGGAGNQSSGLLTLVSAGSAKANTPKTSAASAIPAGPIGTGNPYLDSTLNTLKQLLDGIGLGGIVPPLPSSSQIQANVANSSPFPAFLQDNLLLISGGLVAILFIFFGLKSLVSSPAE